VALFLSTQPPEMAAALKNSTPRAKIQHFGGFTTPPVPSEGAISAFFRVREWTQGA
jgi:hypothetical protein